MKRIAFKPALALAIRERRKTVTRRLINPQPKNTPILAALDHRDPESKREWYDADCVNPGVRMKPPAYKVGEIVGVVEPWHASSGWDGHPPVTIAASEIGKSQVHYLADGPKPEWCGRFRRSLFLPDAFVRTKVRITGVEVQRVNDISESDAKAEGCDGRCPIGSIPAYQKGPFAYHFAQLWDSIHEKDAPWTQNPWVWVYRFELWNEERIDKLNVEGRG